MVSRVIKWETTGLYLVETNDFTPRFLVYKICIVRGFFSEIKGYEIELFINILLISDFFLQYLGSVSRLYVRPSVTDSSLRELGHVRIII